jgi:hypothetical protein
MLFVFPAGSADSPPRVEVRIVTVAFRVLLDDSSPRCTPARHGAPFSSTGDFLPRLHATVTLWARLQQTPKRSQKTWIQLDDATELRLLRLSSASKGSPKQVRIQLRRTVDPAIFFGWKEPDDLALLNSIGIRLKQNIHRSKLVEDLFVTRDSETECGDVLLPEELVHELSVRFRFNNKIAT